MSPSQSKMPSDSIKVVPGSCKLRVESSNPVARGNPIPRPSKVKLITPEEAIQLHSGVSQVAVPPVSESPRPKPVRATSESSRPKPARATSEGPRPVPAGRTPEAPRPVPARPTSEPPIPVPPHPAEGFTKEMICGLRASNMNTTTVRQRTNPRSLHQPRKVELPPSPRALQIRSRVEQQAAYATHAIEGTVVEVGDKAKDHVAKETCQSTSDERISELLLYRPALHPTWK